VRATRHRAPPHRPRAVRRRPPRSRVPAARRRSGCSSRSTPSACRSAAGAGGKAGVSLPAGSRVRNRPAPAATAATVRSRDIERGRIQLWLDGHPVTLGSSERTGMHLRGAPDQYRRWIQGDRGALFLARGRSTGTCRRRLAMAARRRRCSRALARRASARAAVPAPTAGARPGSRPRETLRRAVAVAAQRSAVCRRSCADDVGQDFRIRAAAAVQLHAAKLYHEVAACTARRGLFFWPGVAGACGVTLRCYRVCGG